MKHWSYAYFMLDSSLQLLKGEGEGVGRIVRTLGSIISPPPMIGSQMVEHDMLAMLGDMWGNVVNHFIN